MLWNLHARDVASEHLPSHILGDHSESLDGAEFYRMDENQSKDEKMKLV